jgi:hypothetical protein
VVLRVNRVATWANEFVPRIHTGGHLTTKPSLIRLSRGLFLVVRVICGAGGLVLTYQSGGFLRTGHERVLTWTRYSGR